MIDMVEGVRCSGSTTTRWRWELGVPVVPVVAARRTGDRQSDAHDHRAFSTIPPSDHLCGVPHVRLRGVGWSLRPPWRWAPQGCMGPGDRVGFASDVARSRWVPRDAARTAMRTKARAGTFGAARTDHRDGRIDRPRLRGACALTVGSIASSSVWSSVRASDVGLAVGARGSRVDPSHRRSADSPGDHGGQFSGGVHMGQPAHGCHRSGTRSAAGDWLGGFVPAGALQSFDGSTGVVAGVGAVLVFLPQILILFLFLAILERLWGTWRARGVSARSLDGACRIEWKVVHSVARIVLPAPCRASWPRGTIEGLAQPVGDDPDRTADELQRTPARYTFCSSLHLFRRRRCLAVSLDCRRL